MPKTKKKAFNKGLNGAGAIRFSLVSPLKPGALEEIQSRGTAYPIKKLRNKGYSGNRGQFPVFLIKLIFK